MTTLLVIVLLGILVVAHGDTASVALTTSASSAVGTLDLSQVNETQSLSYELALTTTFDATHTLVITEVPNAACIAAGDVLNPLAVADNTGCSPTPTNTTCPLGSLSARQTAIDLGLASNTWSEAFTTLFGLQSLRGRGIEIRDGSGDPVACGTVSPAIVCDPATEIIVSVMNNITNTQCDPLRSCSRFFEYQTAVATNISQPECEELTFRDSVRLSFQSVTKRDFLLAESTFTAAIGVVHGVNADAVRVSRRAERQVLNSTVLDITYAAVDNSLPVEVPLTQAALLQNLSTLFNKDNTTCSLRSDPCDCSVSGIGNSVSTGVVGCFEVANVEYCVVNGDGTSCPTALDANVLDAVRFPSAGPFAIACPASLPVTCLGEVFDAQVLTFVAAPPPVSAEIDVPEAPTVAEEVEDTSYSARGMQAVANGAKTFMELVQPETLPYAAINYQIQYQRENDGSYDQSQGQKDAQEWLMPFAILSALSILLFLFLPCYLFVVCCCRCCGCCQCFACCCCKNRCGGEYTLPDDDELVAAEKANEYIIYASRTGFWIYTIVVLATALVMLSFASIILVANEKISEGVEGVGEASTAGLDNMILMANQTTTQLSEVPASIFEALLAGVLPLLDNLNSDISLQVQDLTRSGSTNIIGTLLNLSIGLDTNLGLAQAIEARTATLTTEVNTYTTDFNTLNTDAGNANTFCVNNIENDLSGAQATEMDAICNSIVSIGAATAPIDTGLFPSLAPVITDLTDMQANNLSGAAAQGQIEFDNIPFLTDNKTSEAIDTLTTELDRFQDDIRETVDELAADVDKALYEDLEVNKTKADIQKLFDTEDEDSMLGMSTRYRTLFSQGVAGVFILLACLTILVVVLTPFCFSDTTHPADRSCMSDCGGRTLLGVAGTAGVIVTLLNLLLAFLILFFGITGKVCLGLSSDGLITEIADEPANWGQKYPIADAVLANSQVELTGMSILDDCAANKGVWTVFQLDKASNDSGLPNLDELSNVTTEIDIAGELGNINLGSFEIVDNSTRNALIDYQNLNLGSAVTFSDFDATPTFFDTATYIAAVQATRDSLATFVTNHPGVESADITTLDASLSALQTSATNIAAQQAVIEGVQAAQLADVAALNASFAGVSTDVAAFLNGVDTFDADFDRVSSELLDFEQVEQDVLSVIETFTEDVQRIIRNDIGHCKLVTVTYYGVVDSVCTSTHGAVDAWWFSMALTSFCALLLVFLNIKMASYSRRQGKNPLQDLLANDKRRERRKSRKDTVSPVGLQPAYSTSTLEVDIDHVGRDRHGDIDHVGKDHHGDDVDGYEMMRRDNQEDPPAYNHLDEHGFRTNPDWS
eukprot:m.280343 g.280343  ORF g.280343 m.280343 type:complete len:1336 (+) comp17733_c0_seq3:159-4166(+)